MDQITRYLIASKLLWAKGGRQPFDIDKLVAQLRRKPGLRRPTDIAVTSRVFQVTYANKLVMKLGVEGNRLILAIYDMHDWTSRRNAQPVRTDMYPSLIPDEAYEVMATQVSMAWIGIERDRQKRQFAAADKYKNKKEVPKAKGKGTTTVYEYSDQQVQHRNREKAKRIEKLRNGIEKLRTQYKKDLKSTDDTTRATALVIALMDVTYERVGNEGSASDGHFGVTGWKVKHISFGGSKATIKYTGKSGVDQAKIVTDAAVVSALRAAVKEKGDAKAICDATAEDANAYLKPFGISAKDLRGLHANQEMIDRLKAVRSKGGQLPSDPKERDKKLKAEFDEALNQSAEAVGHEPSTLRSQYLVPGLEDGFMSGGTVKTKMAKMERQVRLARNVLARV